LQYKNIFMEIWKNIKGFEGAYQVSNHGRVKSLYRVITRGDGVKKTISEKIMNPSRDRAGYPTVCLSIGSLRKPYKVHRLVLEAFIENPENKACVNHKNGVKHDNRLENLEWATHQENSQHAFDTGLRTAPKGKKHWAYGKDFLRANKNQGITKDDIRKLQVGQFISEKTIDKAYIQRLRNYCHSLKSDNHDYTVKNKKGEVIITRIDTTNPQRLTDKLRCMKVGDVIYPAKANKQGIVAGTAAAIEGQYEISTVVKVVRIK
jgi:hypothetical protein